MVEGGAAASWFPLIAGHNRAEKQLLATDTQVTRLVALMHISSVHVIKKCARPLSCRERVNKSRVKEIVKEFTLLCRGLHGTEYAAEY